MVVTTNEKRLVRLQITSKDTCSFVNLWCSGIESVDSGIELLSIQTINICYACFVPNCICFLHRLLQVEFHRPNLGFMIT